MNTLHLEVASKKFEMQTNRKGYQINNISINYEEDYVLLMDIILNTPNSSKAYQTLFENHKSFIFKLIYKYHPSLISNIEISSQDIFNLSIVKVQKKIFSEEYQYDGRATFKTYIFTVYRYTAMEISKEFQKKKFDLLSEDTGEKMEKIMPKNFGVLLEPYQYINALIFAIQKIENKLHQKVLHAIYLTIDNTKDIANKFNIAPITVRQIKNRKSDFLKEEVAKYAMYLPMPNV